MEIPLTVLMVEDRPEDAELLLFELKRAGFAVTYRRAETEQDYLETLDRRVNGPVHASSIDLILADYSLPRFGAVRALQLLKDRALDIPLIVVTGTVSEEVVVECIKLGAADYLLKDRLTRLPDAVRHAIQEKTLRYEKKLADEALRRYAIELEKLVDERTAQLREAKEQAEAILSNTSDALVLASFDGVIRQSNPAFTAMFGYSIETIAGCSLLVLAKDEPLLELLEALRAVVNNQQPRRIEIPTLRADGTTFDADIAIDSIAEGDRITGIICSVRDISARMQVEEELRKALAREKELSELKLRFTSMVSHEFRTPLSVIQSSSDLLLHYGERLDEAQRHTRLAEIQAHVKHLKGLLDDVLTINKAQSVGLELRRESLDLMALCAEVTHDMQMTAIDTHEIIFTESGMCHSMFMDGKLMRQTISNLLSNAIKYSPKGGKIYFDLLCDDGGALIRVKDAGIGIPLEDQPRLFETFHRAGNVGTIAGSGLGLMIVKEAVELHGGTIMVESEPGVGTTFTLTFPSYQPLN
jgi:PAS domain S-box-containing protein